ncbi:MAG: UDP-2,3-diacylglucosamine diphosphatase [Candidatus Stahlbacteria bacterium]|nr:UDP-2,3-diacylglucosamine diphosphatase [Candidatus Stahlbacteria bacterium]
MAVYFISDAHFGDKSAQQEKDKVNKFIDFIEHIKGCETLFIVGDLFDFYFEYHTQIPKSHFAILNILSSLRCSGTKIYYLVGNHDYWVGELFTQTLGIEVCKKPLELTIQDRKLFIAHGDELSKFDPMRWLLKNKIAISLFYCLHPDLAYLIGRWVSKLSAKTHKVFSFDKLYEIVNQKFANGFDAIIFGHIHSPKHIQSDVRCQMSRVGAGPLTRTTDVRKQDFLLIGDWVKHFTYIQLQDGEFKLLQWQQEVQPQPSDEPLSQPYLPSNT